VVTVRFETRGSGAGPARTFAADTDDITRANPLDSLDWPDYLAAVAETSSAQATDDVAQG
jgi:DNA polymerase-4